MKRIYLISVITVMLGFLFTLEPHWFTFFWGWQILLLPLTAGILMVLVQNEDRSYRFLPKLIVGSLLTSFVFVILWQIVVYNSGAKLYIPEALYTAIYFSVIIIFGGLIGIVIRGITLLLKKNPQSKSTLLLKKIFGVIFLSLGTMGLLTSVVIFLIISFNPASPLLNRFMVDFKLIEVIGVARYYIFLLSALFIISIPAVFVIILGSALLSIKKNFLKLKVFICLILLFFLGLAIFFSLSAYTESKFEEKRATMKENKIEKYFNLQNFNSIYVSRFVAFDEITIKQGDEFSIVAKGSQYDLIGLGFANNDNILSIKRLELESYYNTETWTVENDQIPFPAGTKYLKIEITMPDIKKIDLDGGHLKLDNLDVDNIEIKLNKRFTEIKGSIIVKDTLKLDANGGVINFTGSAKNLLINSGDCWIEMDKFMAEKAIINAQNTSRLNVNVSGDMEIQRNENSGITNHYDIKNK
ncbi:MAG: DUF2807 domain-containing protein [Patescibacteria group bacterium]